MIELPVEEEVERIVLSVGEVVEGVELFVGKEVQSWLSNNTSSFNLFMSVSCDFCARFLSFYDLSY